MEKKKYRITVSYLVEGKNMDEAIKDERKFIKSGFRFSKSQKPRVISIKLQ